MADMLIGGRSCPADRCKAQKKWLSDEVERLWDTLELSNQKLFDMCDKKDAAYALLKQCKTQFHWVDGDLDGQLLLERIGELLKADE